MESAAAQGIWSADCWPQPSEATEGHIRAAATIMLRHPRQWADTLAVRARMPGADRPAVDPVLLGAAHDAVAEDLRHWVDANRERPGQRVAVCLSPRLRDIARALVRRGLPDQLRDAYRIARMTAWKRWAAVCAELAIDAEQRYQLLDLTSLSLHTFIDDVLAAISIWMDSVRADLAGDALTIRRATVTGLLAEDPIDRRTVEARLGYSLSGPHTAMIIWDARAQGGNGFRAIVEMLTGADVRPLVIPADPATWWLWLPEDSTLEPSERVCAQLARFPGFRIGIGRPGRDLAGFRDSHRDALRTRQVLDRLGSPRQLAHYGDVQLVSLLVSDFSRVPAFLRDTLGGLLDADPEIQHTAETYIAAQFNTSVAAARLFAHRNTVVRRLARVDELLPRPLSRSHLEVAAALAIVRWSRG